MPITIDGQARPIAFVDVETTGLDPVVNRIVELGIVFPDASPPTTFTVLFAPGRADADATPMLRFADVAPMLAERLAGHVLVAHNARFDHAFLRVAFEREGLPFDAPFVCSLRLARALYPQHAHHDVDALLARHGFAASARHRALPDAQVLAQFWTMVLRDFPAARIAASIAAQWHTPLLPEGVDGAAVAQLPDAPGIYTLHAEHEVLRSGVAGNLRLHVQNLFRLDRASTRTLALALRVRRIDWRQTQGPIGAHLMHATQQRAMATGAQLARRSLQYTWAFDPASTPALHLHELAEPAPVGADCYGAFTTERRARLALARLAARHRLCDAHVSCTMPPPACAACSRSTHRAPANVHAERSRHLLAVHAALRPLAIAPWPHPGAVVIRERRDLHVVDQWRYLGTVRAQNDVHEVAALGLPPLDVAVHRYLARLLPRLPARAVRVLQR